MTKMTKIAVLAALAVLIGMSGLHKSEATATWHWGWPTFGVKYLVVDSSATIPTLAVTTLSGPSQWNTISSFTTTTDLGVGGNATVTGTTALTGLLTATAGIKIPATTPLNSAACSTGTIVADATYLYRCMATGFYYRSSGITWTTY